MIKYIIKTYTDEIKDVSLMQWIGMIFYLFLFLFLIFNYNILNM